MITTLVSYLSHSQIWALQEGDWLHVGGTTNRATLSFTNEMEDMLNDVPELRQPQAAALQQAAAENGNGNSNGSVQGNGAAQMQNSNGSAQGNGSLSSNGAAQPQNGNGNGSTSKAEATEGREAGKSSQ